MPPARSADDLLAALDPEQREVATTLQGPLCVLAGAGTGKTRAITSRIAYGVLGGVYVPQRVLAVTFTARAAGEMRTRLRDLGAAGVQARTFHAAALRQLRWFWPRHVGGDLPELVSHKAGLVAEAAGRLRLATDRATVRDLSGEVEWVKVTMTDRDDYPAAAAKAARVPPAGLDPALMVRLLSTYEQVKRDRNVIDFEDVLLYTVGLIAEHRQVADAIRGQYHQLVVDEYQDVSPLQQRLLDQWLGDREEVCVVGDPNQTIYTFAGASPDFLLGFRQRHPSATRGAAGPRLPLHAAGRRPGQQDHHRQCRTAGAAPLELVAQRPAGPEPDLRALPDEPAEARHVATRVQDLLDGRYAGQRGRDPVPHQRPERDLRAGAGRRRRALRAARRRAVLRPARGARGPAAAARRGPVGRLRRPAVDRAGRALRRRLARHAARERRRGARALGVAGGAGPARRRPVRGRGRARPCATSSPSWTSGPTPSTPRPSRASRSPRCTPPRAWSGTPSSSSASPRACCPITLRRDPGAGRGGAPAAVRRRHPGPRAPVDHLVAGPGTRRPGRAAAVAVPRRPARVVVPAAGGPRAPAGARAPATCRVCGKALTAPVARKLGRCEDCPSTYDEELFERLREWRAEQAREASVPAYVVFTDATLTALAEVRPTTEPALLGISGIGRTKLERYGADVLALCAGDPVAPRGTEDDDSGKSATAVKKMIAPDGDLP